MSQVWENSTSYIRICRVTVQSQSHLTVLGQLYLSSSSVCWGYKLTTSDSSLTASAGAIVSCMFVALLGLLATSSNYVDLNSLLLLAYVEEEEDEEEEAPGTCGHSWDFCQA